MKRVIAERDVMANLKEVHPCIVRLHFAFQDDSHLFFVMDCLKTDLYKMVQGLPGRRVPVDGARLYLAELVLALEFLHDQHIIFLDVKLENLLVSERGHVQLADFGLARYSDSELQSTLVGTPSYFSPEMLLGTMKHNQTMDVWAFGIVAYELLCGLHPFDDSGSAKHLFQSIMGDDIHFPTGVQADTDGINIIVKRLIQGLLTKEPSARLGGSGWEDVKAHPFFTPLRWNLVYDLSYDPLLKPPVDAGSASLAALNEAYQDKSLDRLSRNFKRYVSPSSPHSSPKSSPSSSAPSSAPPSPLALRRKLSSHYIAGTTAATARTALATQLSSSKSKQCSPLAVHLTPVLTRHLINVDSKCSPRSPPDGAWHEPFSPTLPLDTLAASSLKTNSSDPQAHLTPQHRLQNAVNAHRAAISKETLVKFYLEEATNKSEQLRRTLEVIPAYCAFAKLSLSSRKFVWCCPYFGSMMGGGRVVDMGPSDFCLESDWQRLEDILSKSFLANNFSDSVVAIARSIVMTLKPPLITRTAPFVARITMKRCSADDPKGVLLWRLCRIPDEKVA
jgi:serine/threonine protein kinase